MFYSETPSKTLRFGDVLKGFLSTYPKVLAPSSANSNTNILDYQIYVSHPQFVVVMTPCCSIEDKMISLTPLIEVKSSFFSNENWSESLIKINEPMESRLHFSNSVWEKLPDLRKQKAVADGVAYCLLNFFIYDKNDLLPEYVIHQKDKSTVKTNYYMIDFRSTFKVSCDDITRDKQPMHLKALELSIGARDTLRNKVAKYFSRVPDEDRI